MEITINRIGTVNEARISDEFTVMAITSFQEENNNYKLSLLLKMDTIDIWDKTNDDFILSSEDDVYSFIVGLNSSGYFKRYIERYKYQMRCFEVGNDTLSKT